MIKYIKELKNRLYLVFINWLSILIISYFYKESILFVVTKPYYNILLKKSYFFIPYFIFTNLTEIFSIYITLVLFFSFQIVITYFMYHLFLFMTPAFYKKEYSFFYLILKIFILTWILSFFISNCYLIPLTWDFFFSFYKLNAVKSTNLHFEAKLIEFIDFYIQLYYIYVIYFQTFTILVLYLNFTKLKIIKKIRKFYYCGFTILATLFSPPDILSQIIISIALIIIYETILFIYIFQNYVKNLIR